MKPTTGKKHPLIDDSRNTASEYRGKQTKTGNSLGFRFEGALFKSHPEFKGEVKAHVIAPGRMLVTAVAQTGGQADPVMASFLAFVAQNIARSPQDVKPLDANLTDRIDRLTKDVIASPDDDLGDEALL